MAMKWEDIGRGPLTGKQPTRMFRTKVPGGWLVALCGYQESSVTFYPDPEHTWSPQESSSHHL